MNANLLRVRLAISAERHARAHLVRVSRSYRDRSHPNVIQARERVLDTSAETNRAIALADPKGT